MFMKFTSRALVVCVAAATILFGFSAAAAQAANRTVILSDVDGRQLGYMVHLDAEPDRFKVCDTQNDGATVTGRLFYSTTLLKWTTDGSDAGCNYFTRDIRSGYEYRMTLCWDGSADWTRFCTGAIIRE